MKRKNPSAHHLLLLVHLLYLCTAASPRPPTSGCDTPKFGLPMLSRSSTGIPLRPTSPRTSPPVEARPPAPVLHPAFLAWPNFLLRVATPDPSGRRSHQVGKRLRSRDRLLSSSGGGNKALLPRSQPTVVVVSSASVGSVVNTPPTMKPRPVTAISETPRSTRVPARSSAVTYTCAPVARALTPDDVPSYQCHRYAARGHPISTLGITACATDTAHYFGPTAVHGNRRVATTSTTAQ